MSHVDAAASIEPGFEALDHVAAWAKRTRVLKTFQNPGIESAYRTYKSGLWARSVLRWLVLVATFFSVGAGFVFVNFFVDGRPTEHISFRIFLLAGCALFWAMALVVRLSPQGLIERVSHHYQTVLSVLAVVVILFGTMPVLVATVELTVEIQVPFYSYVYGHASGQNAAAACAALAWADLSPLRFGALSLLAWTMWLFRSQQLLLASGILCTNATATACDGGAAVVTDIYPSFLPILIVGGLICYQKVCSRVRVRVRVRVRFRVSLICCLKASSRVRVGVRVRVSLICCLKASSGLGSRRG